MDDDDRTALGRILSNDRTGLLATLADELTGADLTTLLLEVMRRRAERVRPADLMRRYAADRFVVPSPLSFDALRRVERAAIDALPETFDRIELAPLVPLGTHRALGAVHQNRVVSSIRGSEVAADPTNGLALEAARRRRRLIASGPRSDERVRLAAVQRVVRGQRFEDPAAYAHFTLFGLVTAGRDTGTLTFERETAAEHVRFAIEAIRRSGSNIVHVEVTDFHADRTSLLPSVLDDLSRVSGMTIVERPDRTAGRGYYPGFCFKAFAILGEERFELADGGHVDWAQALVESRKERLMISGMSLDRLALVAARTGSRG